MKTKHPHILVLGAGCAGPMAAIRLAHKATADLTLVNASPMFDERVRNHQLAAGLRVGEHALADLLRGTRIRFVRGTVPDIVLDRRRVAVP